MHLAAGRRSTVHLCKVTRQTFHNVRAGKPLPLPNCELQS